MALIYGLGFPSFRGGLFGWIDSLGLAAFCEMTDRYRELGPLYQPTDSMREMAAKDQKYFG